jgi:hypothetical protein
VRASLAGVPPRLVDRLTLSCGSATATTTAGALVVSLPRASGPCEASALDAQGRELVRASQGTDTRAEVASAALTTPEARDDTPFIVLGVVGAAIVIAGAIAVAVVLTSPSGDATLAAPTIPDWSR